MLRHFARRPSHPLHSLPGAVEKRVGTLFRVLSDATHARTLRMFGALGSRVETRRSAEDINLTSKY